METGVKEVELRDLWKRYKDQGDNTARERLAVAYSPMVKFVAGRLGAGLPSHVEDADLISYGLVGLIGAIERFEPERGIKFETFAMTRIRGAIIDELRSLDWVPRSVRSRAREIEQTQAKLEHELQRAPSEAELAAKLNMTEEELQSALLEIANSSVYALDELWTVSDSSGDQVSLLDTIADDGATALAGVEAGNGALERRRLVGVDRRGRTRPLDRRRGSLALGRRRRCRRSRPTVRTSQPAQSPPALVAVGGLLRLRLSHRAPAEPLRPC